MASRKSSPKAMVLDLIKRHGPLTAQAIATALKVSPVAARKHLTALETQGLVRAATRKIPRGRPTLVYELTSAAENSFPQRYQQFALDILTDIRDLEGQEKVQRIFDARYERLRALYEERLADKGFVEQLQELARLRDEDGYMAVIKEQDGVFVLQEHHCPIQEVAVNFPEACQCEQELYRKLLNREVSRESSVVEGAPHCSYRIETTTS